MRKHRFGRLMRIVVPGMLLLQTTGCDFTRFNESIQTVFLGLTAAGSVAILQNI